MNNFTEKSEKQINDVYLNTNGRMNVENLKLIYVHREILRDNVKEKRQEIKDIKKQIKEINSLFRVIKHFLGIKPVKV